MRISVIIPVYNAERFLKKCLDSVSLQSIKDKEIICIDDGSSDDSYEILNRYREQCPYLRVFRQENRGAGTARNVGLKEARGKYVCFLDADDFYLDPTALEKMVCACERNQLQVCAGLRKLYREEGTEDFFWCRDYFKNGTNPDGVILQYREHQDDYYYQNYIFDLEVIRRNGILFPPYRRYEDPVFFLRFMLSAKEYMVLPIEFYGYRFSKEALCRKDTYVEDTLKGIRDNIKTARENQMYELEKVLIRRIGMEYVKGIVKNPALEIQKLLYEIQAMVFEKENGGGCGETQDKSFENVLALVGLNRKRIKIGEYFRKRGVYNVAVYGLGCYGNIVIEELRKSKEIILYGVDQKVKEMAGVEIGDLEEVNMKCTDIIVTPVEGNEKIVEDIKRIWNGNIWGLNSLLKQVLNNETLIDGFRMV